MTEPSSRIREIAERQRNVALLILGTVLTWVTLQGIGAWLDLPLRLMGLLDLVALAALAWAMFMLWRVHKMRREEE